MNFFANIDTKAAPPMPANAVTASAIAPGQAHAPPAAAAAPNGSGPPAVAAAASAASSSYDRPSDRRPVRAGDGRHDRAPREFNRARASEPSSASASVPVQPLANFEPPTYPTVADPKSTPKFMYSRAFLLKVARASKLIEVAPKGIMPELLRPLAEAGPVHAPPAAAGSVPRTATKLGAPAGAAGSKFNRDDVRGSERDRAGGDRDRPTERDRDRPAAGSERRWNEPRERDEPRGGRNEREERSAPREGMRDKYGRFEATPTWANTEVKSTLDDDTFGGSSSASAGGGDGGFFGNGIGGDGFLFGKALDRDADAKIMQQNGWGEMFRANEELEKKAAAERAEIRRQMQQEAEEADAGSGDFSELPPNHPLMLQKQRALDAAAAAARNVGDAGGIQSDDELARLDELLAAKAARDADAKKGGRLGSVAEESGPASSPPGFPTAPPAAMPAWAVSAGGRTDAPQAAPADGESAGGRSKFASRFGFAMQEEAAPAPTWGGPTLVGGAEMGAPSRSKWGFSLDNEEAPPVDQSLLAKFASTPNTIQKLPMQPQVQVQQPPMHVESQVHPQFVPVSVGALFQQASTNPMPSMPAASSAPLPAAAAAAIVAEDPLQRLVSKHRNRKATGITTGVPPPTLQQQQIMMQQAQNVGGPGIYPQGVAAGLSARYDAPPQQQHQQQIQQQQLSSVPQSMLQNPAFRSLPPAQQQQYLRSWEQQQQQQPPRPQQLPQQPAQVQSHYVSVNRPPAGFPGQPTPMTMQQGQLPQHHQQQQQQQQAPQAQSLPPGMLRRPMMQNPQSVAPSQPGLPAHMQLSSPTMIYQQQTTQHAPMQTHQHQQQTQHMQQQPMRTAPPNYGLAPPTYAQPTGVPQASAAPGGGGDGLSRWFSHLQTQSNMPAVPQGAHAPPMAYAMQAQPTQHHHQQPQQQPQQQQRR